MRKTVYMTLKDSLGRPVADYQIKISKKDYDELKAEAEELYDGSLVVVIDCEVDGELGWREIYL